MIKAGSTSRILGIDPGTNILGFAVIEVDRDKIDVLEIGVLHLKDKGEHTDCLLYTSLTKKRCQIQTLSSLASGILYLASLMDAPDS